jgi:ABC-type nitrate/sulfonate/bicarbonate transport system permease component
VSDRAFRQVALPAAAFVLLLALWEGAVVVLHQQIVCPAPPPSP